MLRAQLHRRGRRVQEFDRYYDDPWSPLDAATRRRLAPDQRARGAAYARALGCTSDGLEPNVLPEFVEGMQAWRATQHCD